MAPLSPKPTVLLVPGGWHPPSVYQLLTTRLSSVFYPTRPLQNPSLNSSSKGLSDDISNVRSALQNLVENETKEVVLVLHSYGGLPGSVGVTGYGKSEREKSGKNGGVIGILCISATILPAGVSQVNAKGRDKWLYWPKAEDNTVPVPEKPSQLFYNDISPEAAQLYVDQLQPQGFLSFDEDVPPYSLGCIPITYLICSQDLALLPATQERVVKLLGENCTVERCDASHSPFLSKLDLVVDLIEMFAHKKA